LLKNFYFKKCCKAAVINNFKLFMHNMCLYCR
jgi:hypothetical protein